MTDRKTILSVWISFNYTRMIWSWVAYLSDRSQKICVQVPHSFLLEDSIEQAKNLSAQQFIISIDNDHDILLSTEVSGGVSDVGNWVVSVSVDDDLVTARIHSGLLFEHISQHSSCAVCWPIINDDEMEIFVILHQNRSEIPFCSFARFVVKSRNNDAER